MSSLIATLITFSDYTLLLPQERTCWADFLLISLSFSSVFSSLFISQNDVLFHLTSFWTWHHFNYIIYSHAEHASLFNIVFFRFSYVDDWKYILLYSWCAYELFQAFAIIKKVPVLNIPAPFPHFPYASQYLGKHLDIDDESINSTSNTWYGETSSNHSGGFTYAFPWYWLNEAYLYVFWLFSFLLWSACSKTQWQFPFGCFLGVLHIFQ